MTTPTILDKDGERLSVGCNVERVLPNGCMGGLVGTVSYVDRGFVDAVFGASPRSFAVRRSGLIRRTYRCPDLQLAAPTQREESLRDD